jgi:hypothetical protein
MWVFSEGSGALFTQFNIVQSASGEEGFTVGEFNRCLRRGYMENVRNSSPEHKFWSIAVIDWHNTEGRFTPK